MKRIIATSIIIAVSLITSRASMAQDIIHIYDYSEKQQKMNSAQNIQIQRNDSTLLVSNNFKKEQVH